MRFARWSFRFLESRRSKRYRTCSKCGRNIGPGDNYSRQAIPPWGYEDEYGYRYSIGSWLVIFVCWNCDKEPQRIK